MFSTKITRRLTCHYTRIALGYKKRAFIWLSSYSLTNVCAYSNTKAASGHAFHTYTYKHMRSEISLSYADGLSTYFDSPRGGTASAPRCTRRGLGGICSAPLPQ